MSDDLSIARLLTSTTTELTDYSDSARLDTELLLCHCLNKPRSYLYAWPEHTPDEQQLSNFRSLTERRKKGEPVAYLTGSKEFWSESFNVTPDTLIPRPDTETLVELTLSKLATTQGPFLDLGTGSGVISICVALERPDIEVHATDISDAALKVAQSNTTKLGAKVEFFCSNWFENLKPQQYTVIASNPPYIAEDDPHLQQTGLPYEPIKALRSRDNGFSDITAIINATPAFLMTDGWLLLEHGWSQGKRTRDIMLQREFGNVQTVKDLSGNDRVTLGQLV